MTTSTYNRQESIDRYLLGEMTADEEREFQSQMAADPELNDEVALMRRIMAAISLRASRDEKMARWDNEADSHDEVRQKKRPVLSRPAAYLSAAASAAVIFMLGGYILNPRTAPGDDVMTETPPPHTSYTLPSSMRGSAEASVATIGRELHETRETARFALVQIENALADTLIDKNISAEEADYQRILIERRNYDLRWLRINALIAAGQIEKAREELALFATEDGYYRDEAEILLRQFK